jgi:hypothetical protein
MLVHDHGEIKLMRGLLLYTSKHIATILSVKGGADVDADQVESHCVYQVKLGSSKLYDWCVGSVKEYCEEHGFAHVVQTEPVLKILPGNRGNRSRESCEPFGCLPIFEKENAFELLADHDKVAVIDADVFIRPGSPSIFEWFTGDFAAAIERLMPITDRYKKKLRTYSRMQFKPLPDVSWDWRDGIAEFCNMGVMLISKGLLKHLKGESPREFLGRREFRRFVDGVGAWKWSTDQVLLNWWIRKAGVDWQPLDWRWNALYRGVVDERLPDAHAIHFFLKNHLPSRGENVEELRNVVQ